MYQPIIQNSVLDKKLLEDGFVVLPFLNMEEVQALINFYHQHHTDVKQGIYATAHVEDIEFRQKIDEGIKQYFKRAIAENLMNINPLGGSYIVKGKGEQGVLEPHMDWNIVDEDQFRSFNIWVSLVNVSEINGAVKVLPGSHNKAKLIRGANIDNPLKKVYPLLWNNLRTIEMPAGAALLYDHRLIHASSNNQTEEQRLAIAYGIMQKDAQMFYYYRNKNKICEYHCNPSFFISGKPNNGPIGLSLNREFEYNFKYFNSHDFAATFKIQAPQISWIDRIKALFRQDYSMKEQ